MIKRKAPYPSKQKLYARMAKLTPQAITQLEKLLTSKNSNARLGAIKQILNKTLPDLKAIEVKGDTESPLGVVVLPEIRIHTEDKISS